MSKRIFGWQRSPKGLIPVIFEDEIIGTHHTKWLIAVSADIPPEHENQSIVWLAVYFAPIAKEPIAPLYRHLHTKLIGFQEEPNNARG